jgi:hypothetical protein
VIVGAVLAAAGRPVHPVDDLSGAFQAVGDTIDLNVLHAPTSEVSR